MDKKEIWELLSECKYKPGWELHFVWEDRPYIQWEVQGLDSINHQAVTWKTGKRYLSEFMCRQEIVASVFSLALAAEEHEAREWFRYKGASIYNPHLDPEALAELARKASSFNMRENAMNPE